MSDRLLQDVPIRREESLPADTPVGHSMTDLLRYNQIDPGARPLVEPMSTFASRVSATDLVAGPHLDLAALAPAAAGQVVSHRQWQTTAAVSQGSRGTCWAFAGCNALEAAYARVGVAVHLSPHYLFHMSKAHENHRAGPGIHSLIGFQGSSAIIQHLTRLPVPADSHVPYIDQGPLQALANSIPDTGGALANAGAGTREQDDWFEFDLRHVPLEGRWFAQYGVSKYGQKSNFTNADIKAALSAGYDVVVDAFDKINNGGHVLLIFGFNDNTQTFEIKNSQSAPGWGTMAYVNDPQFTILYNNMYYISEVAPVATHMAPMWVGRWETDHDGWHGTLVIRRHTDLFGTDVIPGPNSRISLGTWYGRDGGVLDVVGHFVDGGRGLRCNIGNQPFEVYLHTSDPYRAAGRTFWNGSPFGVVWSRGNATGAGGGFDRTESIGFWDMTHDGWRGTLRIGVDPSYVSAADAASHSASIDAGAIAQEVSVHVNFGATNPDQRFQVLVHTREDGMYGGVSTWNGHDWPVEGRMSPNLYTVTPDGTLRYYRHLGRARLAAQWDDPRKVGTGWAGFDHVFGGGDGVVYGIQPNGDLLWYYHDGRNQGGQEWQGPMKVGTGWNSFVHVFAGDGGVVYGVEPDGRLLWYRHLGRVNGSPVWQGPFEVGTGWTTFTMITAGPDGCVYGVHPNGEMLWYRHNGYDKGYPIWYGPKKTATGWAGFDSVWSAGNGYMYARTRDQGGDLYLWRHHGFLVGDGNWSPGTKVGNGWGGGMRHVFVT